MRSVFLLMLISFAATLHAHLNCGWVALLSQHVQRGAPLESLEPLDAETTQALATFLREFTPSGYYGGSHVTVRIPYLDSRNQAVWIQFALSPSSPQITLTRSEHELPLHFTADKVIERDIGEEEFQRQILALAFNARASLSLTTANISNLRKIIPVIREHVVEITE